ncbi:signal peptidase II [Amycolatopsis acidiphila]|uniref:Signal peptidase II n=1 Tax=Amycolatopsis acidiphila TaxID=715473 RepID=A0A558AL89_9PSEU|nr:signal peptidase II [Amycolatopsis acidiphila]TVT25038.1 signal peptidase II [Amycolatopsis acidiphila]UIJ57453.1 signal peptidase II [Amycolatopsis acidiphila]
MNRGTTILAASSVRVEQTGRSGQRWIVPALLALVIVLDQAMKWWAWRHVSTAIINDGGDALVGTMVGGWYADPVTGALLDLADFGLLSIAVSVLVRRRPPMKVVVPAALMLGGWSSNLLDRLGMHYWTAPGSVRGAVDFIQVGQSYYNIADFFIIGATPLFLLALGYLRWKAANRPAVTAHKRLRQRLPAFAGAIGVVVVVGIGAAHYGGLTAPLASVSPATDQ